MSLFNNKIYWKNYWSKKTDGEHRSQNEDFLKKESQEKIFHLAGGNTILDYGCGSADLLAYYSQVYPFCMGVDYSELMLKKAEERLQQFDPLQKILLIHADDTQVWDKIDEVLGKAYKFDRITAGQVMQYFNKEQIEKFICNSLNYLSNTGSIYLFDVVDSRTYELWKANLFESQNFNLNVLFRLIFNRLKNLKKRFAKKPLFDVGYLYPPAYFHFLANKYNLEISIANSLYYEYRYHVILTPCKSVG